MLFERRKMCYALMADEAFDEEESKYKRVMNV